MFDNERTERGGQTANGVSGIADSSTPFAGIGSRRNRLRAPVGAGAEGTGRRREVRARKSRGLQDERTSGPAQTMRERQYRDGLPRNMRGRY